MSALAANKANHILGCITKSTDRFYHCLKLPHERQQTKMEPDASQSCIVTGQEVMNISCSMGNSTYMIGKKNHHEEGQILEQVPIGGRFCILGDIKIIGTGSKQPEMSLPCFE